jgi:hypothetical protein
VVSEKKIFTYEEARALLPEVQRLTREAQARIEGLQSGSDPEGRAGSAQARLEGIANDWAQAVMAMGIEVKGLWLVDFDNGSGYYCWQHPEDTLDFYHSYDDGFRGRMRIQ